MTGASGRRGARARGRNAREGLVAVIGGLAMLVAGCASPDGEAPAEAGAAAPAPTVFDTVVRELQRTSQCVSDVEEQPAYALLRLRTPEPGDDPASPMFSDPALPTPEERRQAALFVEAIQSCQPQFPASDDINARGATQEISRVWADQQTLYASLVEGGLAWGRFNQLTRNNANRLRVIVSQLAPPPAAAMADRAEPAMVDQADQAAAEAPAAAAAASPAAPAPRAVTPPPATRRAGAGPARGGYRAHLASYRREDSVDPGWRVLERQLGPLPAGVAPSTERVVIPGRGAFIRLFVGPFDSRRAAAATCAALTNRGDYCEVMPAP